MIRISAPSIIPISGEWGVKEIGVPCIVLAVQQRTFVTIETAEETTIILDDMRIATRAKMEGWSVKLETTNEQFLLAQHTIQIALKYLYEKQIPLKQFKLICAAAPLMIQSYSQKKEVGFGNAAAAIVAIIRAILNFHGLSTFSDRSMEVIFKLSILAQYYANGKKLGAGFDIAASTYGGLLVYQRFDPKWLLHQLSTQSLIQIIDAQWPLYFTQRLPLPKNLELLVGFTGTRASRRTLVERMNSFRDRLPTDYQRIISDLKMVTMALINAILVGNEPEMLKLFNENRILQEELSIACSCHLEIEAHKRMSQIASAHGGVAKFSGAGRGDCSVGVCFSKEVKNNILVDWMQQKIFPFDVQIDTIGVKIES